MVILRLDIMGNPNIGVFLLATDSCVLAPVNTTKTKIDKLKNNLKGEVICTNIGGSRLIGALAVGNTNGVLVPHFAKDEEIDAIRSVANLNVERVTCKQTALGNLVLANDRGAMIDGRLMANQEAAKKIKDVLGVELVQGSIAGLPYVGSLAVATNKGVLTHPMLREGERELLMEVLKVPVDVGTVNLGFPFVGTGLIANDRGVVIGSLTTGPEIIIISNIFGQ